ncbi:hypothetical protein Tco_0763600 [Tanacetum coccineum]
MLLDKGFETRVKVRYVIGVVTLRALVRTSNKIGGDARSWYMISGDAKLWVWFAYIHCVLLTTADEAQSSRVPVPLPDDPYVAVRQAQLVDTESEPEEAPSKAEELQSLGSRIPLMGEEFVIVESSGTRTHSSHSSVSSDSTAPLSPDHPLTHVSPTPTPTRASFHSRVIEAMALSNSDFCKRYRSSYETPSSSSSSTLLVWKRYKGTSELILDTDSDEDELGDEDTDEDEEDESLDMDDERDGLDDEDRGLDDGGLSLYEEGLGLEGSEEEVVHEGQQWAASFMKTVVGQGSGSVPEPKRPERVSALRQPTLTRWIDLEDGIAYIDVPAYLPPAPPVQTLPSHEWTFGSLLISPAPSAVPLPILSPMISLTVPPRPPPSPLMRISLEVGHI